MKNSKKWINVFLHLWTTKNILIELTTKLKNEFSRFIKEKMEKKFLTLYYIPIGCVKDFYFLNYSSSVLLNIFIFKFYFLLFFGLAYIFFDYNKIK